MKILVPILIINQGLLALQTVYRQSINHQMWTKLRTTIPFRFQILFRWKNDVNDYWKLLHIKSNYSLWRWTENCSLRLHTGVFPNSIERIKRQNVALLLCRKSSIRYSSQSGRPAFTHSIYHSIHLWAFLDQNKIFGIVNSLEKVLAMTQTKNTTTTCLFYFEWKKVWNVQF